MRCRPRIPLKWRRMFAIATYLTVVPAVRVERARRRRPITTPSAFGVVNVMAKRANKAWKVEAPGIEPLVSGIL
jgi:hypothetical protein